MATQKLDDIITDLAQELGIPAVKLASMDSKKIKKLMESGDLDPAQKARLVRAHLERIKESSEIVDAFVDGTVDEAEGRLMKPTSDEASDDSY
ncbi:MAG: hypothetical protein CTY20_00760 [Hyphomicrobium sp.]|nr:MAG: hypothetical protein CTY20_00760 [Hyphomicrobium sp.]